jgi:hypothetical protein
MEKMDYAAEIFKAVEGNYGKQIKRIVKFEEYGKHGFKLNIIFTDYRILEAKVKVETVLGEPCITLEGTYY